MRIIEDFYSSFIDFYSFARLQLRVFFMPDTFLETVFEEFDVCMQKNRVPSWRICKCASIEEVSQYDWGSGRRDDEEMIREREGWVY